MLEWMGFGQAFSREVVEGDFSSAGEKKITGWEQEFGI